MLATLETDAAARVIARLPRCASRSQADFTRLLERQIATAVDDDRDRHGEPAAPSPVANAKGTSALHTLPIQRVQRDALQTAVLAELTPPERAVLQVVEYPQESWVHTAHTLGLTVFATKRLNQHTNDRG